MARRARDIGSGEALASALVLAALLAIAAWLLTRQAVFSPAVEVALRAPAPKAGQAQPGAAAQESATAPTVEAGSDPAGTAARNSGLAAFLPEGAGGLSALGPAEVFNPVTLSDKIDGKAELYLAAGFKAMADRTYSGGKGKLRVDLYLYEMKNADAAFSVFSGQRRSGAGKSAVTDRAYATENAVFFASGPYYAEVIADRAGPEAGKALDALARAVAAALPGKMAVAESKDGAGQPRDTDLFPPQGQDPGSLRLLAADVFGVQGLTGVYTMGYKAGQAEATGFLSRRKSAAEAQELAGVYLRFLADNGYRELAGALPGVKLLEMDGSFEAVGVAGPVFFGVHDATARDFAVQVAAQLAKNLEKAK